MSSTKRGREDDGGPLSNVTVYVACKGIPFVNAKLKAWRSGVARLGGRMASSAADARITHVVAENKEALAAERQLIECKARYVSVGWLEECLREGSKVEELKYPLEQGRQGSTSPAPAALPMKERRESRDSYWRRKWIGTENWHPCLADMSLTEFMLQGVYNVERSTRMGNETLVHALRELTKYERAIHEDYFDEDGVSVINHRALRYSKAATAVRGASYKVEAPIAPGQLPFVGSTTAAQIDDILRTGSCQALDHFRADVIVNNSRGESRPETTGGTTRARFHSLPGIGQRTAKLWWDLGLRSFEDVELAAQPGGDLSLGKPNAPSPAQLFSLQHREDLLEGTNKAEVQGVVGIVKRALEQVSGTGGWEVYVVGGEARGGAVHDTDLLVTNKVRGVEQVVNDMVAQLVEEQVLFPAAQAMCQIQTGLLPTHLDRMRSDLEQESSAAPGYQTLDKFDHFYGMYRTSHGKIRRLDIILVPPDELAMALVGWIGSRTYLRLMRQHAKNLGMYANSHRLMRKVDGKAKFVPDEVCPLLKDGTDGWPEGWHAGRRIESQEDVFALLSLPYRDPKDRNCP